MVREFWKDIRYRLRAFVQRDDAERALNAEIQDHSARQNSPSSVRDGYVRTRGDRHASLSVDSKGSRSTRARPGAPWPSNPRSRISGTGFVSFGAIRRSRAPASSCWPSALLPSPWCSRLSTVFSFAISRTGSPSIGDAGFRTPRGRLSSGVRQRRGLLRLARATTGVRGPGSHAPDRRTTDRNGRARTLQGARATASVFSALRVRPVIGRVYTEEEQLDAGRASSVAVLSYGLWQRRFGCAPSVGRAHDSVEWLAISGHRSDERRLPISRP